MRRVRQHTGERRGHTDLGRARDVPHWPRVALVTFDCLCTAYVPVDQLEDSKEPLSDLAGDISRRRLEDERAAAAASAATAAAARAARSKSRQAEPSFDSETRKGAGATVSPAHPPSPHAAEGGRARIDDQRHPRGSSPRRSKQAARPGQRAAKPDGRGTRKPGGTGPREGAPTPETGSTPASSICKCGHTRYLHRSAGCGVVGCGCRGHRPREEAEVPNPAAKKAMVADGRGPNLTTGPYWTRERIIQAIQEWAEAHGMSPSAKDWKRNPQGEGVQHPVTETVYKVFGSWPAAVEAAGLTPRQKVRKWPREDCIAALQKWAEEHGRSPSTQLWESTTPGPDWPSRATIIKRCGSWSKALAAAGLDPAPAGPRREGGVAIDRRSNRLRMEQAELRAAHLENLIRDTIAANPPDLAHLSIEYLAAGFPAASAP